MEKQAIAALRANAAEGDGRFAAALWAARALTVYRGALEDRIGQAMLSLLESLAEGTSTECGSRYAELFSLLAEEVELGREPVAGDAWQNHLLDRILLDENPFSRKVELAALDEAGPALVEAARRDMVNLRLLFDLEALVVASGVEAVARYPSALGLPLWSGLCPINRDGVGAAGKERLELKRKLAASKDWSACLGLLASHYRRCGTGVFGRYRALRWTRTREGGLLAGIERPDPIRLSDLVGYERERALLLENTEHFLAGYPANNVLLYGDRGTGKSSTIKALLNEYGDRGLRLIEVCKQHLSDLPAIVSHLRGRQLRFILYVDDLSFDEHETDYKSLKAVLEGGLESMPENVLLYATSNRRHLVRERFGDRDEVAPDEIHTRDTVEEKLSLSDRFGITLVFVAPDQERFLGICEALAARRGLRVPPEGLRRRALQWVAHQKGFSGRTARQLVDYLVAESASQARMKVAGGHLAPQHPSE